MEECQPSCQSFVPRLIDSQLYRIFGWYSLGKSSFEGQRKRGILGSKLKLSYGLSYIQKKVLQKSCLAKKRVNFFLVFDTPLVAWSLNANYRIKNRNNLFSLGTLFSIIQGRFNWINNFTIRAPPLMFEFFILQLNSQEKKEVFVQPVQKKHLFWSSIVLKNRPILLSSL